MLYSNIGKNKSVLEQALVAASLYREAGDSRGLTRALSQIAARYAILSQYDDAERYAEEALQLARSGTDRRLLADTLRRCADSFAADDRERVRALYAESVALFRGLGRNDETARALEWWGKWEEDDENNFQEAAEHFLEAARLDSGRDVVMIRAVDLAGCYLAIGENERAEPFAREALAVAAKTQHPVVVPLAISYIAIIASARDVTSAARLIGYAEDRLRLADWQRAAYEQAMVDRLYDRLKENLTEAELKHLLEEGSAWSDDQAAAQAASA
jgi:tetratricopeptide (TPR) repeat protein